MKSTKSHVLLNSILSKEEIEKYGVVGIEIKKI